MLSSFTTFIPEELDPNETDIEVFYEFTPAEKQTRDYPGCDADANVYAIEPANKGESISDYAIGELMDENGKYFKNLCEEAFEDFCNNYESAQDAAADAAYEAYREEKLLSRSAVDIFAEA